MKRRDFITKSISAGVVSGSGFSLLSQQANANAIESEVEMPEINSVAKAPKSPPRKMRTGLVSKQEFVIIASDVKLRLLQDDNARLSVVGFEAYGRRLITNRNDELGNLLMVCVRNHVLKGKYALSSFQADRARMEGNKFTCDLIADVLPLTLTLGIRPAGHTLEFTAQACWTDDSKATLDIIFPFFVNIALPGAQFIMPRLSGAVYEGIEEYNVAANYSGHLSAPFHIIQSKDIGLVVLDKSRAEYQVDPGQLMRRAFFNANNVENIDEIVKSKYFTPEKTNPTGIHFNGIIHTCEMRAQTDDQKYMEGDIENMGDARLGAGAADSMWFGDYKDLGPIDIYVYRGSWKTGADFARRARAHVPMYKSHSDWAGYATFLDEDNGGRMVSRGQTYYDLRKIMADKRSNGADLFMFVGFHQGVRLFSPMVNNWINRGDYQIPAENLGGFQAARRGIEALHRQGGHVICYVESLIVWKLSRIGLEKGKKWALMNEDGSYCEHYKGFWHMCPSCDEWIDYLAETCAELVRDWCVDGFFIDSLSATFAHDCHNPAHNHPHPYTWNWGLRRLLRKVREAINQVNPNSFILIEGCSDLSREYCDTFLSQTSPWLGERFSLPVTRFVYPKINVYESGPRMRDVIFNFVNGCLIRFSRNREDTSTEIFQTARMYHDMYPELSECQISLYDAQVSETVLSQLFEGKESRILTLGNVDKDQIIATVKLPFDAGALFDRVTGKYIEFTANTCKVELPGFGIGVFDVLP